MGNCGDTWGAQEIKVFIADRTGAPLFEIDTWQSIVGGPFRIVDSVSNLIVVAEDSKWLDHWETINPWQHELQLYTCSPTADSQQRNHLIWAGPVQRVTITDSPAGQRLTLSAQDLLGWLAVRTLEGRIRTDEIATQFAEVIQEAMEYDDIGLATNPQFISVVGTRRVTDLATALSELRELGRDGVDFTMFGRRLFVGSEEVPFGFLPSLSNSNCESVSFTKDGSTMATQVAVSGGTNPETNVHHIGLYPPTVQVDPQYGLVQRRFHETSILDDESVQVAALTRYHALKPVPIVGSIDLLPDAPVTFQDLIAGKVVDFSADNVSNGATIKSATGRYRLISIDASILREGEEGSSRMTLNLQPIGTVNEQLGTMDASGEVQGC